jgi:ribosomal RNA assembly protein
MIEMEESEYMLRIPKDRVGVLIGQNGKTKDDIETKTKTRLNITKEGEVTIEGSSFESWIAKQIVKAIGRGFSPANALLLLKDDYSLRSKFL